MDEEEIRLVLTILADTRSEVRLIRREPWPTMAKKRKRISAEEAATEQAAWDERTREINAYIDGKLRRRIEERKAAEEKAEA